MSELFELELDEPPSDGKWLEALIRHAQTPSFKLIRLPDAHAYGGFKARAKVPCDFIGYVDGHPLMVEAKSTRKNVIYRSNLLRKKSIHQFQAMREWDFGHQNNVAGYLCHTAENNYLLWVPVYSVEESPSFTDKSIGTLGIRGVNLTKQAIDWQYLLLGVSHGQARKL